jgi:rod shape-determining protein MreD
MLCLVLVWVSRKREFVPLGLIVFVFLITDFLLMRPPGLWTALVVLGSEFMRTRTGRGVEMPFLLEWALASVTIATIIVIHRLVLLISAVPVPPLGTDLVFMTVTILAYPFVLAFSHYVFGVRRAAVREKSRP